ncbi:MAG: hypothetical protein OEY01_14620 [Desulfobulbaceae bacterium]|nr:hypothetical protein [Desulfobulbaceae bacterium]
MPESYSWETRESAEELYIINGLTYEQVADHTGVSVSQLKRWGQESSWRDRRKMYRQAQTSIRYDVRMAKAKIIKSVIESQDPQKAFAFNSLVSASAAIEKEASGQPKIQAGATRIIKTSQDAVDALRDAVQKKINAMLTEPGALSFAAIKDTKQAMEMVEQLAARYKPDTEEANIPGGLSDEGAEEIINRILGTSK